ncbi:MAG: cytochrome c [Flavobacteriales bacterium]|nr:cytochrome c [Flavobacteriales bacterium]
MKNTAFSLMGFAAALGLFASCTTDPDAPGVEYMPDMYRSPALEAYVDYGTNEAVDWTEEMKAENGYQRVLSRRPPEGTIPFTSNPDNVIFNMPYPLDNTVEGYDRAALEIHSPIKSTKENVEKGKAVYTLMCTHCHGATGKGDGAISKNGLITGIPDYSTKLANLPEGQMFHSIFYGKNLMGSHASQLTRKEIWQVIEYVKCLQKGITDPTYDATGMLVLPSAADTTKID